LGKKRIRIKSGGLEVIAQLNQGQTAQLIWDHLPLKSHINTWGEEIYFPIPVRAGEENPRMVVERGDIGYWPPGEALCIFFGQTPISRGEEIKPASPVNIIGRVEDDLQILKRMASDGAEINIEKVGQ
jgi:hypothetical protein